MIGFRGAGPSLGALVVGMIGVVGPTLGWPSAVMGQDRGTAAGEETASPAAVWEWSPWDRSHLGSGGELGRGSDPAASEPLTLEEAIRTALDRNRDLREAELGLQQAETQVSEAWGEIYPRVDLTTSYTRNLSPAVSFLPTILFDPDGDPDELIPVQFGADNAWMGEIQVSQPLFEARAFIGVGAAGEYENLQVEVVRGRTQEVVTQVRNLFYDVLLAEEQARLTQESLRRVTQSLEETRAMREAGIASDFDVLRLEVELANLEPNLRRAENAYTRARRELALELDLENGEELELAGTLAEMDLEDPEANDPENRAILGMAGVDRDRLASEEELVEEAYAGSSLLRQSRANEDLRHAEMRVEQAEYLPRISLFGSYQVQAQQDGGLDFFGRSAQRGYGRNIGVQVTIPVFTGRQRGARVERSRAALREARLETEVARERAALEVRSLVEDVEESRMRATGQALAVRQATRAFEIASAEFREGTVGHLELTDTEVALRESEFNYAEAVHDYLTNRARLDAAVGRVPLVDSVETVP